MRILIISAFYPPYVVGGWEQLVQDININLQERGHITQVLTSNYGVGPAYKPDIGVARILHLEGDLFHYKPLDFFLRHKRQLEENLLATRTAIEHFNPDVVFIHVMWNLSRGIAWLAEQLCPGRVVYYIANDWPYAPDPHRAYWTDSPKNLFRRVFKGVLSPFAMRVVDQEAQTFSLKFENVMCVSQATRLDLVREAGIPRENISVVYNGVETDLFFPDKNRETKRGLSLLFAGNLASHKGVHTAIQAMALIARDPGLDQVRLTMVGSGHPGYIAYLKDEVDKLGLSQRVEFKTRVERAAMPALLRQFDVLVFPSIWQEPLARIMQEAMASGLVVVGTATGGTPEILRDEETGLTFAPEDAAGLARQIERLYLEKGLRTYLSHNAHQLILEKFTLARMIDEIEAYLGAVSDLPVSTSLLEPASHQIS